ncbi:2-keto-4-pentenoate hydratase/2-oxohepta-3-ene-1,7-dioic acid hydratase (catechol pathway) [Marivita hallyeonensis]|uniref:2-keto-4-pentenoate hydratase/2-oxohepta-3-ene-1,7-dioic acid hydratase (Catechol pathway) n=2 Tax=Marivita hallyeonensis TaxID=996342 RepID=A0A1M5S366_9RHOB|nr:2-keto-4-pentenoate hydratase/2-oxohepta-3-ene-1,7-dioic acid hydratase (catechol pathway) [Marivita hallyeonensis]
MDKGILDFRCALERAVDLGLVDQGSQLPGSLLEVIQDSGSALATCRRLHDLASAGRLNGCLASEGAALVAPIPKPHKNVFCVGRNYAEHIAEGDRAQNQNVGVTEYPVFFTKPPTSIVPPDGDTLIFPSVSESIDYEVELAVVIGKPGRNIPKAEAMDHVFGYTIVNDISARDIQRRHGGQYFKGKGMDGSCPVGPCIVTDDEIEDPHNLSIGLSVNGETRQDGTTSQMIFDIPTLIASLSEGMTLEPGDIIATGTPSGVGYAMEPPRFLKDGDLIICSISGIGELRNTVRAI